MEALMSSLLVGNLVVPKSLDFARTAPFGTTLERIVRQLIPDAGATGIVGRASIAGALVLLCMLPTRALAQSHAHGGASPSNALVQIVRDATERFKSVEVAENEQYHLMFGCVSGPDFGAMGLHYVNMPLVLDGELDPTHPEIILYEALPNGRLKLTGADFLVLADAWDTAHPGEPPQIMGQLLHRFEAPNRFGLPNFYTLHVWAWKESPTGTFVNWHSNVSCDAFIGQ
jgi:hypothetical protein